MIIPGSDDLNFYLGAIGAMFQEVSDLADDTPDGEPGWSVILDVNRVPDRGLPWLAQLLGVELDYALPLRQQVRGHDRWGRGTPGSMIGPASRFIPEGAKLYVSERNPTPYHVVFIFAQDPSVPAESTYTAEVAADNPLTWYRMNAISGVTETDRGSLGHNGTYINNPNLNQPGLIESTDPSVAFSAAGNQYMLGVDDDAYSIRTTGALTVEFWYRFDVLPGVNVSRIVSKTWFTNNQVEWLARVDNGGVMRARVFTLNGTILGDASFGAPTLGVRHHYVFTVSTNALLGISTLTAYLDGAQTDQVTFSTSLMSNGISPLQISGSYQESAYNANGIIDEVSVYGTALSPARISTHYATGIAALFPDAQTYEDLFEVFDSYYHVKTTYATYASIYGDLRGDWTKVANTILVNKPGGIQFTFISTDSILYMAIYILDAAYSNVYVDNATYEQLYSAPFPDITMSVPMYQQLVSAKYYRNVYNQFETFQHLVDAYVTY